LVSVCRSFESLRTAGVKRGLEALRFSKGEKGEKGEKGFRVEYS
jgi:hypothetical protein